MGRRLRGDDDPDRGHDDRVRQRQRRARPSAPDEDDDRAGPASVPRAGRPRSWRRPLHRATVDPAEAVALPSLSALLSSARSRAVVSRSRRGTEPLLDAPPCADRIGNHARTLALDDQRKSKTVRGGGLSLARPSRPGRGHRRSGTGRCADGLRYGGRGRFPTRPRRFDFRLRPRLWRAGPNLRRVRLHHRRARRRRGGARRLSTRDDSFDRVARIAAA